MANYTGNPSNMFSSNSPFSYVDNDFIWESLNPFMANTINPCLLQNPNLDYQSLMGFCNDQIPTNQTSQLLHAKLLGNSNDDQSMISCAKDHVSEHIDTVSTANGNDCSGNTNKRKADDLAESSSSLYSSSPNIPNAPATRQKNNTGRGNRRKSDEKVEGKSKEVVHVRARRGQATDSHSIAERVRRGKINERLKCLQDIVPGCYKSMGMAVMLDEIINYVQSLQNQVEFLSMKLTAASHFHDFNSEPEHMDKKQKIKPCNSDEAQDVERVIFSKGGYDNEALLPNLYQSTWSF